jgi:hypothetical protein
MCSQFARRYLGGFFGLPPEVLTAEPPSYTKQVVLPMRQGCRGVPPSGRRGGLEAFISAAWRAKFPIA